jgi:hypothetical protein
MLEKVAIIYYFKNFAGILPLLGKNKRKKKKQVLKYAPFQY